MSTNELYGRIEGLKLAIAFNRMMLGTVPAGADKKTEAQVKADVEELKALRAELEKLEAA